MKTSATIAFNFTTTIEKMDHYFSIEKAAIAEFKDRGSRFIAHAFPIDSAESFKKQLAALKKEHPKAVHHCFAYRIGTTGDNFRSNDDGEPSGSAGKPILGQIDSKAVTNTAIVVIRYFGGTLLGVPGLINAYKTASSLALQTVPILKKPIVEIYDFYFDYTTVNDVMSIVKQFHCQVIEKNIQIFSHMRIGIPRNRNDQAVSRLTSVRNAELKKILH